MATLGLASGLCILAALLQVQSLEAVAEEHPGNEAATCLSDLHGLQAELRATAFNLETCHTGDKEGVKKMHEEVKRISEGEQRAQKEVTKMHEEVKRAQSELEKEQALRLAEMARMQTELSVAESGLEVGHTTGGGIETVDVRRMMAPEGPGGSNLGEMSRGEAPGAEANRVPALTLKQVRELLHGGELPSELHVTQSQSNLMRKVIAMARKQQQRTEQSGDDDVGEARKQYQEDLVKLRDLLRDILVPSSGCAKEKVEQVAEKRSMKEGEKGKAENGTRKGTKLKAVSKALRREDSEEERKRAKCRANPGLGWAGEGKQWQKQEKSKCRPVGFALNTRRVEQYQTTHPSCAVQSCTRYDCKGKDAANAIAEADADAGGGTVMATVTPTGTGSTLDVFCGVQLSGELSCWQQGISPISSAGVSQKAICPWLPGSDIKRGTWGANIGYRGARVKDEPTAEFNTIMCGDDSHVGNLAAMISKKDRFQASITLGSTRGVFDSYLRKPDGKRWSIPFNGSYSSYSSKKFVGIPQFFVCGITTPYNRVKCFPPSLFVAFHEPTKGWENVTSCPEASEWYVGRYRSGPTSNCQNTVHLMPPSIRRMQFKQIVASTAAVCGITLPAATVICWGHPAWADPAVWPPPEIKFKSIQSRAFVGEYPAASSDGGQNGLLCGVNKEGRVICWGPGHGKLQPVQISNAAPQNINFKQVEIAEYCGGHGRARKHGNPGCSSKTGNYAKACGLSEIGRVSCWSLNKDEDREQSPTTYRFVQIDILSFLSPGVAVIVEVGNKYPLYSRGGLCGVTEKGKLVCQFGVLFGESTLRIPFGPCVGHPDGDTRTRGTRLKPGMMVTCGGDILRPKCIEQLNKTKNATNEGEKFPYMPERIYDETCGFTNAANEFSKKAGSPLIAVKMTTTGSSHSPYAIICVTTKKGTVKCWNTLVPGHHDPRIKLPWNEDGQSSGTAPNGKFIQQTACKTSHVDAAGSPTGCTSCPTSGAKYHTIMNPTRNTGTCSTVPCPFCKPSACCGPHHKHFVINTDTFEGVCVRHTDDCTPLCMPREVPVGFKGVTVCSKGCNQLIKVSTKTSDKPQFVVCQSDKRVTCDPSKPNELGDTCVTVKTVKATAICKFETALWNLGGTCVSNHVHNLKHKECPGVAQEVLDRIPKQCHKRVAGEHSLCTPLAYTY